ncbi:hypothetical protein [Edaphobacter aggregans]|uniref:hypothetical protein n=1 Tax=Edaphobacter aggregans TaxID=570835 RepID=UPI000558766A|nr:hypothetical protein [Edaphobacter aggregans]
MGEVVLLFAGLGADGHGIEDSGGEGVAYGLGGAVAEVALAEDLMARKAIPVYERTWEASGLRSGIGG